MHFYRNVFSVVLAAAGCRKERQCRTAIHAQEDFAEARRKARAVADKLDQMKLRKAAEKVCGGASETLSYYHFPREQLASDPDQQFAGADHAGNPETILWLLSGWQQCPDAGRSEAQIHHGMSNVKHNFPQRQL